MDVLPLILVDRMCLFLSDIRDASALQRTCKRLQWAGLGPECKWHWELNFGQSNALIRSALMDEILRPGTSIRTLIIPRVMANLPEFEHVWKMLSIGPAGAFSRKNHWSASLRRFHAPVGNVSNMFDSEKRVWNTFIGKKAT